MTQLDSRFHFLPKNQATVQAGVPLRGRELPLLPAGGDRLPRVPGVALHQRQPAPAVAALRAGPLRQARDHEHRELPAHADPGRDRGGGAVASHTGASEIKKSFEDKGLLISSREIKSGVMFGHGLGLFGNGCIVMGRDSNVCKKKIVPFP